MPIQAPQWTDYLNCPVCCREFGAPPRSPISLACGHTLCKQCLRQLHRKQCPFDQSYINVEPEELVVNTALLQLAGYPPPSQPYHPPCIQVLTPAERDGYDVVVKCMEHLAQFVKCCGNLNNNASGNRLSRPMQRKLVTLFQCAITDEEGRGRAARAARSLGERTVMELILQHQHPQQLSAHLWAAVRARGCQFLGPAMQEEVLKLVLLALEDGSAISRKVLVMFVVQRMEQQFPQASKTSIGHVVQLLYRASCFKVSKRERNSSLMQLKEEFRTYESLRREHDAQIVQIATEAGLRIAPDQWSSLLYGDTSHKSHMQSVIDKLQTPQSFLQSVQELFVVLHRTGDPSHLLNISIQFEKLATIETSPDAPSPRWGELAEIMMALKDIVTGLIRYLHKIIDVHNNKPEPTMDESAVVTVNNTTVPRVNRYKTVMCRDFLRNNICPRAERCNFAHSEEEMCRARQIEATHRQQETVSLPLPINFYRNFPPPQIRPTYVAHPNPQINNVLPVLFPLHPPLNAINVAGSVPLQPPEQCLPYGFGAPVDFRPPEDLQYHRADAPMFVLREPYEAMSVPPQSVQIPQVQDTSMQQELMNNYLVDAQNGPYVAQGFVANLDQRPRRKCPRKLPSDIMSKCARRLFFPPEEEEEPLAAGPPMAGPSTRYDDAPPQAAQDSSVGSNEEDITEGARLSEADQKLEEELKALERRFDHEYEWSE